MSVHLRNLKEGRENNKARIMVVEDEGIIAQDIKNCLENLGYIVPDVVYTGTEAIEKAAVLQPDLILMDIVLKGDIDGIETASEIRKRLNIPIVYLTAYEDDKTLKRARVTQPEAYILKPFEERYLRSSIEMALYKHKMESRLRENQQWLGAILRSVGEGVVVTDVESNLTFMNPIAEFLTGYTVRDAMGKNLNEILKITDETTGETAEDIVSRALEEDMVVVQSNHVVLHSYDGNKVPIDSNASPMRDEEGNVVGAVLVFRDISERRIAESALRESELKYRNLFENATDAIFVESLDGYILSVNNEACRLLGYNRGEIYSLRMSELSSDYHHFHTPEIIEAMKRGESHTAETQFIRRDKSSVDIEISMRIIRLLDEEVVQIFARDITERKRSQKQINMMGHALKSVAEIVSMCDLNNRVIFVNSAFVRTYGYAPDEIVGKPLNIIRSQKNPPELISRINNTLKQGGWQGELLGRSKDGREFPVYLSTSVVRDDTGNAIAILYVSSDITERKALENALKNSERDYKGLFENAHDAIIIYRPEDETILDINKSACKLYGYKKSEFVGMSLELISGTPTGQHLSENNGAHPAAPARKSGNGFGRSSEAKHYRKDGSEILLEVNTAVVDYKGQNAVLGVYRDITERKRVEQALRESEKRYQDLYDNAPEMYFSIDRDGIIKSVNKYGAAYLGYAEAELIDHPVWKLVHPDDLAKAKEFLRNIFARKKSNGEIEFTRIKKDGTKIWVRERTRLITDETGEPSLLFIASRDVSERKEAEEALRESQRMLSTLISNLPAGAFYKRSYLSREGKWRANFVSEGIFELTGFHPSDYVEGKVDYTKSVHADDLEHVKEEVKKAIRAKTAYKIVYRITTASGEEKWVWEQGRGVYDTNDELIGSEGFITDITERKKNEEALRISEGKYRKLAESMPVAVTRILMKDNHYEFVNDEFVRQSGYTMEEFNNLEPQALIDMVYPEDRERVFSFYRSWRDGGFKGTQHIDYRIINRRNEVLWLDTYLYADFDNTGSLTAINQVCVDVTEQKRALHLISESDKRFRALIENSSDLIALVDKDGRIVYASPSTERILGYDLDDYVGSIVFDYIHPDDVDYTKRLLEQLRLTPGGSVSAQYRAKHLKGKWLWIEATGKNLLDDDTVRAIVVNYKDITERKLAEQELLLQKTYFQQLFESSPEGIVILDKNDRVVNVNKGFERLFQYSLDEIKGKHVEFIVPEHLAEQAAQMSLLVLKGEVIHKETIRKRKDGSLVEVSVLAYPITLDGDQLGVYGIYSDISERKETEKALLNSEERYKAFVQQSSEGIWRIELLNPINIKQDSDEIVEHIYKYGFLAECNDAIARMYGYQSADEIIGARLGELVPQSNSQNVESLRDFVESGFRLSDAESHDVDRQGNIKYSLNNLVGIIDGVNLIRIWGTRRDITKSKLAEQELKRTQLRLATLLNNLPNVVLYETGAEQEFISENVMHLLGYPAEKFKENRSFFQQLMHPGDLKIISQKIAEWRAGGEPGILTLEFRCRREDGAYIWLEDHMVAIKSPAGKTHMAGVMVDITDRKRSEERLKLLAEKLSISNRELEQFAYVASHDLQEPLRMVASYVQLLQRRYRDKLGSEADEYINYAVDGVVRMKTLINDLLIYSRVNTQELPPEETDCNEVINKVIRNLKTAIQESNAEVTFDKLPVVLANHLQLTQLFQNLVSNGIKFHRDVPPRVHISAKQTGAEWLFAVEDNGIGIEKEYLERIFVIFQRLHNYMEYPGTGIGLAICKKIVEKLGGHIWAESEVGKGSTFCFTIPTISD
jgi:PAS domain S-box-containing protein